MDEPANQDTSKEDPPSFLMTLASRAIVLLAAGVVALLLTALVFWVLGDLWPYPKTVTFLFFYLVPLIYAYLPRIMAALRSLFATPMKK